MFPSFPLFVVPELKSFAEYGGEFRDVYFFVCFFNPAMVLFYLERQYFLSRNAYFVNICITEDVTDIFRYIELRDWFALADYV